MRQALRTTLLLSAGLAGFAFGAPAVSADPLVIPGIGPGDLPPAAPSPRPPPATRVAAASQGGLGGGFLEFVVTGNSGQAARYNTPPEAAPRVYYGAAPSYGPPPAPAYAHVAALPAAEPALEGEPRDVSGEFRRQEVDYDGHERPGTIVIDTPSKYLYLVQPGGRAIRYGIGVGRPGFEWSGVKTISRKAEWPGWTPPSQMLLRRPDLPSHMDGGIGNPLGARAMYLGSSLFRIHGTNEPWTIGHNVSSGCIRMMNQDVIDLYNRVPVGTKVIVI